MSAVEGRPARAAPAPLPQARWLVDSVQKPSGLIPSGLGSMLYYSMKHRTQLYLDEGQYRWLKQRAGESGSIAAVVRDLIDAERARGRRSRNGSVAQLSRRRGARQRPQGHQRQQLGSRSLRLMKSVFIDTSAFVALRNSSEAEHERARSALADLISEGVALFTSNYVFAETYTALMVRVGRGEAIEWGRRFRDGGAIDLVHLDRPTEERAWEILERSRGQALELRRRHLLRPARAWRGKQRVRFRCAFLAARTTAST